MKQGGYFQALLGKIPSKRVVSGCEAPVDNPLLDWSGPSYGLYIPRLSGVMFKNHATELGGAFTDRPAF